MDNVQNRIIRDGAHLPSTCSTSGRQSTDNFQQLTRCFASGKGSRSRSILYDARWDVYGEFQAKWDKANAEAAALAEELAGPPPKPRRAGFGPKADAAVNGGDGTAAANRPRRIAPPVVPADVDWPPGYGDLLLSYLQTELPLAAEEAAQMVEAARRGLLPASRELIRTRYMHLRDLEPRFPGFIARSAVLSEPRLLRHSAAKLMRAMLVFQDLWSVRPVGPLMAHIGKFIVDDPVGLAHRIHALTRALRSELDVTLDPRRLTPGSVFLSAAPYELDARVAAVATIFGRQGGQRLLAADLNVLRYALQELNSAVLALRAVFAARGYGKPRTHHVGTAAGAAEAAADRAYVTELSLAFPGVLALPGLYGEEGVAALVEGLATAGGERYGGDAGRAALLEDLAARPEVLRTAAEAAAEVLAAAGGQSLQIREAVRRLAGEIGWGKTGDPEVAAARGSLA
ncbi:hypothetical protein VOLCADRAFT_87665 [Volvox carteri f. nagariensis]|uniref:Uncharacterized protein n=1 Tax=Volvox carteri f. nagariensis TaxID=3068 RepID=D8TLX6_VOLCA|nr:uncharacterized protein VOLCADRAFT_87665 [Volvox carteri f. nagariensis]EFJ51538.1 hypothetical protein VOLCADRAFT_87665 [Volvox carteri f. nagariensis]|eukprot:XP_002947490.1 hypothetical protein VOLCADRAFT_87665 [Volvox carteri f. nagariensis]